MLSVVSFSANNHQATC